MIFHVPFYVIVSSKITGQRSNNNNNYYYIMIIKGASLYWPFLDPSLYYITAQNHIILL